MPEGEHMVIEECSVTREDCEHHESYYAEILGYNASGVAALGKGGARPGAGRPPGAAGRPPAAAMEASYHSCFAFCFYDAS